MANVLIIGKIKLVLETVLLKQRFLLSGCILLFLAVGIFIFLLNREVSQSVFHVTDGPANPQMLSATFEKQVQLDLSALESNGSSIKTPSSPPPKSAAGINKPTSYCNQDTAAAKKYASSANPILKKYSEYVAYCGDGTASRLMVFTGMPSTNQEADSMANDMYAVLSDFSSVNIQPLVIAEPVSNHVTLDLNSIHAGLYNQFIDRFFSNLKSKGLTDAQMGMWAPFPENNIPEWNNVDPNVYGDNVTFYATTQKKYFPSSKSSLMLDSMTYKPVAGGYDDGAYISLAPYIQKIPKGLIDSFGLQGFPWVSGANASPKLTNESAAAFLPASLAIEAAKALGVKTIWLNTGTFSSYHANDPAAMVSRSPQQRLDTVTGIINEVNKLQSSGYSVSVNIFAQDKSKIQEAVNWSYWDNNQQLTSPYAAILGSMVNQVKSSGGEVWLFDSL